MPTQKKTPAKKSHLSVATARPARRSNAKPAAKKKATTPEGAAGVIRRLLEEKRKRQLEAAQGRSESESGRDRSELRNDRHDQFRKFAGPRRRSVG